MMDDTREETLRGADTEASRGGGTSTDRGGRDSGHPGPISEEPGRSSGSGAGRTESKDPAGGAPGRQADATSAVTDPGPTS
jgi:hypothetical protein